jgi:hypothetical protein
MITPLIPQSPILSRPGSPLTYRGQTKSDALAQRLRDVLLS